MIDKLNKKALPYIAALTAAPVAGIRWYYESSMTQLVPTDAQGGIWLAFSAVLSALTFVAGCATVYGVLVFLKRRKFIAATVMAILFLTIVGYTGKTLVKYAEVRIALTDAANPATSPDRLHELIGYPTGFGYEIDNRIALNPNASVETLRTLFKRPNQTGTLMCLARNPHTPEDILDALSKSGDTWILQSLGQNPARKAQ
jgi:hypothetical protein